MTKLNETVRTLKEKEVYELNAQHEWKDYRFPQLLDALYEYWCDYRFWTRIKQAVPFQRPRHVLDVGCGVVSVLNVMRRDFPHLALTGVDPLMDEFQRMYDIDQSIAWKREYLESLDLPAGEFDVVCCTNALDHVEDVGAAFREIRRVISPRGVFLLTLDVFAKETYRNEGHPYSFTRNSLLTLLQQHGFRIDWVRLSRRKIGVMNYANYRIRQGMSRMAVYLQKSVREQARSYAKQLVGRGALGELIITAQAV